MGWQWPYDCPVPVSRSYDDPCGAARALDVVGERWALLVVRELLFGPKRFGTLREGLHGVSPNVLAQRLRDLENAGVVTRGWLAAPANVAVYDLTERGRALEPVLVELGRWGAREPIATSAELGVDALLLALKTTFVPARAFDVTCAVVVDGQPFVVAVAGGVIEVARGTDAPAGPSVDIGFEADSATLRALAFGREPLEDAEASGRVVVTGNRRAARRWLRLFSIPS